MKHEDLIQYTDDLLQIAIGRCEDIALAEDLVQETLLAGFTALTKGKVIENPYQWLKSILYYKHCNWLRNKYNKPTISYDVFPVEIADTSNFVEDLIRKEKAEQVRKELAYLAYTYRAVMVHYYIYEESIATIATVLQIPEGTVKSRLDVGRKQLRKGVEMTDTYVKQSYEPDCLFISCSGAPGLNNEPFSLLEKDKIAENVLILAYSKPISESEVSKKLGIPMAYVESTINKLVEGELLKRTPGGKIYTDFIIYTEEDREDPLSKQQEVVHGHFNIFWKVISEGLEHLRKENFYKTSSKSQQETLELYFCANTLLDTTIWVRNEITGIMPYADYPYRKDGGRWLGIGNMYPAHYVHKPDGRMKYNVSGEMRVIKEHYCATKKIELIGYDTRLGETPMGEQGALDEALIEILFAAYQKDEVVDASINPHYFKYIPRFEALGLIRKEENCIKLEVPVLSREEYRCIKDLSLRYVERLFKEVKDVLLTVFDSGAVQLPTHLKSVPQWQRYMFCGDAVPMMIIYEAIEKGLFKLDQTKPIPATLLIIEKV